MTSTRWILAAAGVAGLAWLLRFLLRFQLTYQLGRSELRIRLWGLTLRRVAFADMERVSKPRRRHRPSACENWSNSLDGSHRGLLIHRKSGWFRKILITPDNRYEFRTRLEQAMATVTGADSRRSAPEESDEDEEAGESVDSR
jgi:hypothetical protein